MVVEAGKNADHILAGFSEVAELFVRSCAMDRAFSGPLSIGSDAMIGAGRISKIGRAHV